jgi:hypothetical protein
MMSEQNPYPSDSDPISIPTDAENPAVVPATGRDEWYGHGDARDLTIVSAEVRNVPGKGGVPTDEHYLDLGVMVDGVFVHTSPFRDHTRFTSASGSKAAKFVKALGKDPTNFNAAELVGLPVIVQVKLVERTNQESGEKVSRNHISNIQLKG